METKNIVCFGFGQVAKNFIKKLNDQGVPFKLTTTSREDSKNKKFENINYESFQFTEEGFDKNFITRFEKADHILLSISPINGADIVIKNLKDYFKSSKFKQGLFSKGWCPPHPTFFVRRSIYEQYGSFDLNYHLASDFDLMIRFLEIHKIRSLYMAEPLVKMRMGGATNKNLKNILQQNLEILNSFHKNSLPINIISFFINKFISRSKQFFKK